VTITANATREYNANYSQSPGGVYSQGKFHFANTIIAKNVAGGWPLDCVGRVITFGGNLVGTKKGSPYVAECQIAPPDSWEPSWPSRAADKIGGSEWKDHIDPQFKTAPGSSTPLLADNGGTSCTHALLAGSPAIDSAWTGGPGDHPFACETWDQRWVTRHSAVSGAGCDIGAFELRGASSPSGLGCTE
jgi:hypothetical protein